MSELTSKDRPHKASHSSIECVVRITALPSIVEEINFHMKRRDSGSTPVVGSSKKMQRGSPTKERPKDSFRLVPPTTHSHRLKGARAMHVLCTCYSMFFSLNRQ